MYNLTFLHLQWQTPGSTNQQPIPNYHLAMAVECELHCTPGICPFPFLSTVDGNQYSSDAKLVNVLNGHLPSNELQVCSRVCVTVCVCVCDRNSSLIRLMVIKNMSLTMLLKVSASIAITLFISPFSILQVTDLKILQTCEFKAAYVRQRKVKLYTGIYDASLSSSVSH